MPAEIAAVRLKSSRFLLKNQLPDCNPEIIAGLGSCAKEFIETSFLELPIKIRW